MAKEKADLFSEDNLTTGSNWFKPAKIGDSMKGYFIGADERENTLKSDGSWQKVYTFVQEDGTTINVAGRIPKTQPNGRKLAIFPGFETLKKGQLAGVKFVEEIPATRPGYNATKICKTYSADEYNEELVKSLSNASLSSTEGDGAPF